MPPTEQSRPDKKRTGPEHYSPLSDQHTAEGQIPPCQRCGKPSVGGIIESIADVYPQGEPIMDLTFLCRPCAGDAHFAVNSSVIWPHYEIMRRIDGPSRLRLRRLSRDAAMRRVRLQIGGNP